MANESELLRAYRQRRSPMQKAGERSLALPSTLLRLAAISLRSKDQGPTQVWLGADAEGNVRFGRVTEVGPEAAAGLTCEGELALGPFDPVVDAVVGLCCAHRRLSRAVDLYVVVRSERGGGQKPAHRVHRATVKLAKEGLLVRPGLNDNDSVSSPWPPVAVDAESIPPVLRWAPVGLPRDKELLDPELLADFARLGADDPDPARVPRAYGWIRPHPHVVCIDRGNRVRLLSRPGDTDQQAELTCPHALVGLAPLSTDTSDEVDLVVASRAPSLVGLKSVLGRWERVLHHVLSMAPTCLQHIQGPGDGRLSLLVASEGSWLSRLEWAPGVAPAERWRTARQAAVGPDLAVAIERAGETEETAAAATALALVEATLESPAPLHHAQALAAKLSAAPFARKWHRIGVELAALLRAERAEAERERVARLVAVIYRRSGFPLRLPIDACLLAGPPPTRSSPELAFLADRALCSRWSPALLRDEAAQVAVSFWEGVPRLEHMREVPGHLLLAALPGDGQELSLVSWKEGELFLWPGNGEGAWMDQVCRFTPPVTDLLAPQAAGLLEGPARHTLVVGGAGGRVYLVDASGAVEDYPGPPHETLQAAVARGPWSPAGGRLLFLFQAGHRTVLEEVGVERGPDGRQSFTQVARHELGLPGATRLAWVVDARGAEWLAVGGTGGPAVHLYTLGGSSPAPVLRARLAVDAGVTALLWAKGGGELRLLVGSRSGLALCRTVPLDEPGAGQVAWAYKAKREVTALAALDLPRVPRTFTEGPLANGVLIAARYGHLVLVDATGRRIWRDHLHVAIDGLFVPAGGAGQPARLLSWGAEGHVAVHRWPQASDCPPHPRDGIDRAPQEIQHQHREMARFPTRPWRDGHEPEPSREARRIHLAGAAMDPDFTGGAWEALLDTCTFRDLAVVLRHMPARSSTAKTRPVETALIDRCRVDRDVVPRGDDSRSARDHAIAELLRLGGDAVGLHWLKERVDDLPADFADDPWSRIELVRAWTQAARRSLSSPGAGLAFADALQVLDVLPPAAGPALPVVLPPACLPAFLAHLATLAREDKAMDASRLQGWAAQAMRLLEAEANTDPTVQAWRTLCQLLSQPTAQAFAHVLSLTALGATLPPRDVSALGRLLRLPSQALPAQHPLPTWTRARRLSWLRDALSARLHLGDPLQAAPGWELAARRLAIALDERARQAVLDELVKLQGLSRAWLELRDQAWLGPDAVRIELRLVPEGDRELAGVQVEVDARGPGGLRPIGTHATVARAEWSRLREGESTRTLWLGGGVDEDQDQVRLEVRCVASGEGVDTTAWTIPLRGRSTSQPSSPIHRLFSPLHAHVAEQIARCKEGLHLFAVDQELGKELLVDRLKLQDGTRLVDLDGALRELGPGRRYPSRFTPRALLWALHGEDPVTPPAEDPPAFSEQRGVARVVAWHLEDALGRLLDRGQEATWQRSARFLAEQAGRRGAPALVLLVSSAQAAALHRALEGAGQFVRPPALHQVPGMESEVRAALGQQGLAPSEVDRHLAGCAGDPRVLARILAPPAAAADPLVAWAHTDMQALAPLDALALILVNGTRCRPRWRDLDPAMVAAEERATTATRHSPKLLMRAGRRLGPIERLQAAFSSQPPPLVRGWREGTPTEFDPACQPLLLLVEDLPVALRRLVRQGFCRQDGGVIRTRELYRAAIHRCFSTAGLSGVLQHLGIAEQAWAATALVTFAHLQEDQQRALFGELPRDLGLARQAAGRVWLGEGLSPTNVGTLGACLAGRAVLPAQEVAKPLVEALGEETRLVGVGGGAATAANAQYLAVLGARAQPNWDLVERALDRLQPLLGGSDVPRPLLVCLGPGADPLPRFAAEKGIAVLDQDDVRTCLRAAPVSSRFWATVHGRTRADRVQPFRPMGALPPGSPMFVGRREVLQPIRAGLGTQSFLILGPRQVGKTSLLNQVLFEARQRPPLLPIFLDCQGVTSRAHLAEPLRLVAERLFPPAESWPTEPLPLLQRLVARASQSDKRPVLLLNEIDGLLEGDREIFTPLRGLVETTSLTLVMVGYATARRELASLHSALYHMTAGPEGERAFNLSPLSREEAAELVGWLTAPPLGLAWETADSEQRALEQLFQRTHGIPWLIQDACARLAGRLVERRDGLLRLEDVQVVLEAEQPLARYVEQIDLGELAGQRANQHLARQGRVLLLALAWKYYLREGASLDARRLAQEADSHRSFDRLDAVRAVEQSLADLPLLQDERADTAAMFEQFPVQTFLDGMCLTILLAPVGGSGQPRYCFRGHIYPRELLRQERQGEQSVLERLLIEVVVLVERVGRVPGGTIPAAGPPGEGAQDDS